MKIKKSIISLLLVLSFVILIPVQAFAADISGSEAERRNHTGVLEQRRVDVFGIVSGELVQVGHLYYNCSGSEETVTGYSARSAEHTLRIDVTLATGVNLSNPKYYSAYTQKRVSATKSASHRGGAATYGTTIKIKG